jgi:hypothetical protein
MRGPHPKTTRPRPTRQRRKFLPKSDNPQCSSSNIKSAVPRHTPMASQHLHQDLSSLAHRSMRLERLSQRRRWRPPKPRPSFSKSRQRHRPTTKTPSPFHPNQRPPKIRHPPPPRTHPVATPQRELASTQSKAKPCQQNPPKPQKSTSHKTRSSEDSTCQSNTVGPTYPIRVKTYKFKSLSIPPESS